jgi:hypothetical protein
MLQAKENNESLITWNRKLLKLYQMQHSCGNDHFASVGGVSQTTLHTCSKISFLLSRVCIARGNVRCFASQSRYRSTRSTYTKTKEFAAHEQLRASAAHNHYPALCINVYDFLTHCSIVSIVAIMLISGVANTVNTVPSEYHD